MAVSGIRPCPASNTQHARFTMGKMKGKCPACCAWVAIPHPLNLTEVCPHPMPPCHRCSTELCIDREQIPGVRYRVPVVKARTRSRLSDVVPDRAGTSGLVPDRAAHQTSEEILECIREAMPHVYRQQGHGKHEQDRADAEAWWAKWMEVRRLATTPSSVVPDRALEDSGVS